MGISDEKRIQAQIGFSILLQCSCQAKSSLCSVFTLQPSVLWHHSSHDRAIDTEMHFSDKSKPFELI